MHHVVLVVVPWTPPPIPSCFAQLFALILNGLQLAMGAGQKQAGVDPELVRAMWNRISGISARFVALVAAFREGRLRPRRPRAGSSRKGGSAKPFRFPSKFGWFIQFGSEVCCRRSQLEHWLATNQDAAAFFAAVPQAARLIRPLWHLLGLELPEALRLPKRVRPPRQEEGKGQRTRRRDRAEAGPQPAERDADSAPAPSGATGFSFPCPPPPGSPNAALLNGTLKPNRGWLPGQKRPLPFPEPGRRARNKPPLVRPKPQLA